MTYNVQYTLHIIDNTNSILCKFKWSSEVLVCKNARYPCSRAHSAQRLNACMQDTFARATHSAKRARDDRVSCIQAECSR